MPDVDDTLERAIAAMCREIGVDPDSDIERIGRPQSFAPAREVLKPLAQAVLAELE